jgi:predicted  nucleic acid-binding Zn-ribbon protein
VARKLTESLGSDASDAMVDWMNGVEDSNRELRADFAELRQEMNVRFAELRQEMNTRFAETREEMRSGFAKIDARFAALDATIAERHADFMKWTLGFWAVSLVTLVGAIAALGRLLR